MEIDDDRKPSPWVDRASIDQTLADLREEYSTLSADDNDYYRRNLHIYWKQVLNDTTGYSPRDVKSKVNLDPRDKLQPLEASSLINRVSEEDASAFGGSDTSQEERSSMTLSNKRKHFSITSLKRRLQSSNIRTSVESSSLSLIQSVINASTADSLTSSRRSSVQSGATSEPRLSKYSKYRRPAIMPFLKLITKMNNNSSGRHFVDVNSVSDVNMVYFNSIQQVDDALVFWCLLSATRNCCDIPSLVIHAIQRCPLCGFTLDHYWARHYSPSRNHISPDQANLSDTINLCARDFFNNTPLHYLAASELDIDSKLVQILRPTAPRSAINYLGQTFLHVLNPKSLGPCLIGLPRLLESLAIHGFPFHQRDHNGRTFFHTLMRHAGVAATNYKIMKQVLRITGFSVHSRARNGTCTCESITLRCTVDFGDERLLREEFTFNNECGYNFRDWFTLRTTYAMNNHQNIQHRRYLDCEWINFPANFMDFLYRFLRRLCDRRNLDWVDINGDTFLGAVVEHWQPVKTQHTQHEKESILKMIINKGADCNIMNRAGRSPLAIAVQMGQDSIVEIIIESPGIRLQEYSCERMVPIAHETLRQAHKRNNHELELASMRILALLGAEIVKRGKTDFAHRDYEIATSHAMALRSIIPLPSDSFISQFIDPKTLKLGGNLHANRLFHDYLF
ncbi:hypothetical protein MMC27_004563 [Xylographa pallens]|nr:hypothetical protein [Xylographa pallens]